MANQAETPEVGALALDTGSDRVGVVMDVQCAYVYLRPPGGGKEWAVDAAMVRPADTASDEMWCLLAAGGVWSLAPSWWPRASCVGTREVLQRVERGLRGELHA